MGLRREYRQFGEIPRSSNETPSFFTSGTGPGYDQKVFLEFDSSPLLDGSRVVCRPIRHIRNGYFQHIFWLGIGGYVIVNYYDREVLLVDPWPTHYYNDHSSYRGWTRNLTSRYSLQARVWEQGKVRLQELANFLRRGLGEGYTVPAILLSHEHFDHSEDIPRLLELLCLPEGNGPNHMNVEFNLSGPNFEINDLPNIYCDYDSTVYLLRYFRSPGRYLPWPANCPRMGNQNMWETFRQRFALGDKLIEIMSTSGESLHYDDSYNNDQRSNGSEAQAAGVLAQEFNVGSFNIKPYVWDHYNHYMDEAREGDDAGNLQRLTSFMIEKRNVNSAKKTFISGSAGEMNDDHTGEGLAEDATIETDLLINSICHQNLLPRTHRRRYGGFTQIESLVDYQRRNITVNDFVICSHWEDFVYGLNRGPSNTREFSSTGGAAILFPNIWHATGGDFRKVVDYFEALRRVGLQDYEQKSFVLGRAGNSFEREIPESPDSFREESWATREELLIDVDQ